MAICAKEMKKPLYVLTESFKFSRIFPLNQVDLPDEFKVTLIFSSMNIQFNLKKFVLPYFYSILLVY